MKYVSNDSRQVLAQALDERMIRGGFKVVAQGRYHETVYAKDRQDGLRVLVYSSCVAGIARAEGDDAIRVAMVYVSPRGETVPMASTPRVFRVGEVADIVERTVGRVGALARLISANPCGCGAPRVKAKSGRTVCADRCWTRKPAPVAAVSAVSEPSALDAFLAGVASGLVELHDIEVAEVAEVIQAWQRERAPVRA